MAESLTSMLLSEHLLIDELSTIAVLSLAVCVRLPVFWPSYFVCQTQRDLLKNRESYNPSLYIMYHHKDKVLLLYYFSLSLSLSLNFSISLSLSLSIPHSLTRYFLLLWINEANTESATIIIMSREEQAKNITR